MPLIRVSDTIQGDDGEVCFFFCSIVQYQNKKSSYLHSSHEIEMEFLSVWTYVYVHDVQKTYK